MQVANHFTRFLSPIIGTHQGRDWKLYVIWLDIFDDKLLNKNEEDLLYGRTRIVEDGSTVDANVLGRWFLFSTSNTTKFLKVLNN